MEDLKSLLNRKGSKIALVGASENPQKYGSIIFKNLTGKGLEVVPINPNRKTVYGIKAYPALMQLPQKPDLINIVTPPHITLPILKQCLEADMMNVWLQPGAENEEVIQYLNAHPFNFLVNACTMVVSSSHK